MAAANRYDADTRTSSRFPPNSFVKSHIHPEAFPDAPGGGLRIVTKGRIFFKGREFGPGDWFFVPNGIAYEFHTDPVVETVAFYKYAFFGVEEGNRFSHPFASTKHQTDKVTHPVAEESSELAPT